jgi:hypothetical protein
LRYFNLEPPTKFSKQYYIADNCYQSNYEIPELECLNHVQINSKSISSDFKVKPFKNPHYDSRTLIGENSYQLTVESISDSKYQILSDQQYYQINRQGIDTNTNQIDSTILLGPVLILNLALNNTFCLHASAFMIKDKAFILMADSGTGKSTIAEYMNQKSESLRLADDILPLKIIDGKLTLLPSFPQLKLTADKQYKGDAIVKETILLFAIKSEDETKLTSIDVFNSIKFLIKHSVATKLFAKNELQNHLTLCHQASTLVKSYRLNYQHSSESLNQLYNLLNEII